MSSTSYTKKVPVDFMNIIFIHLCAFVAQFDEPGCEWSTIEDLYFHTPEPGTMCWDMLPLCPGYVACLEIKDSFMILDIATDQGKALFSVVIMSEPSGDTVKVVFIDGPMSFSPYDDLFSKLPDGINDIVTEAMEPSMSPTDQMMGENQRIFPGRAVKINPVNEIGYITEIHPHYRGFIVVDFENGAPKILEDYDSKPGSGFFREVILDFETYPYLWSPC